MRLLGRGDPTPPPHVQAGIEAADAAEESMTAARDAVQTYWQGRKASQAAADRAVVADFEDGDRVVRARRRYK